MAHCKSLIEHFPGCYLCSAAWWEIKYSDVLSCLSVWCVSAESLSSQLDVHCGVGHKKALELVRLHQREQINAFPSKRFTTVPSTRINSGEESSPAPARSRCMCASDWLYLYLIGAAFILIPGDNPIITHFSLALLLKGSLFTWNP